MYTTYVFCKVWVTMIKFTMNVNSHKMKDYFQWHHQLISFNVPHTFIAFTTNCSCPSPILQHEVCVSGMFHYLTGWECSRLCRLGLYWSTHTTFFISSKLGSEGTTSKNGGLYSSTIPGETTDLGLNIRLHHICLFTGNNVDVCTD